MSAGTTPLHPQIAHLLSVGLGRGAVVAAVPAMTPAHHFYAGVSRAPALSFLEALLLTLGGDLPDGRRRYQEIVVVNAGRRWNEDGLDKPADEILRFGTPAGPVERGDEWATWWFRRPASQGGEERGEEAPPAGGRPDPLAGGRGARRELWGRIVARGGTDSEAVPLFPLKVTATEGGLKYPFRHRELRQIVETLEGRDHPALLLVEMSVLDYPTPDSVPSDHMQISEEGIAWMSWLPAWINSRGERPSRLDVVLYSRNHRRIEAFLGDGLPRRPRGSTGEWHASFYHGRNLVRIEYPCGPFPWGERLFTGDRGFQPRDGTTDDSPEGRRSYSNRSLRALLRGESASGEVARVRFAAARPLTPARSESGSLIDREFWAGIDLPLLRQVLSQRYYAADENQAVVELLSTLQMMQDNARNITDREDFHASVASRWRRASSLFLWGEGGVGKTYLGSVLAELIFGHGGLIVRCQEVGGGGPNDPVLGFRSRFFGAPPGFKDSERLTDAGRHLVETQGFTVVVFDEANKIAPDFGESMEVLYGLVHDRLYSPLNPNLTQDRPIGLWNTIFVCTANLDRFPPPDLESRKQEAVTRRLSGHRMRLLEEGEKARFAQWYLPRAIEEALGGTVVCSCEDLTPELTRLRMESRSPDKLRGELGPVVEKVRRALQEGGVTASPSPLLLDLTEHLRKALR